MKTIRKINPWEPPRSDAQLCDWVSCFACALENGRARLRRILDGGRNNPLGHNLLIELGNIDYVMRTLRLPRDARGVVLHPAELDRKVQP